MEFSLALMSKIASMMIWGLIGYGFVKAGILKEEDSKPLSVLLIYTMNPAALIRSFQVDYSMQRMQALAAGFVFALIIHLVWIAAAFILKKVLRLTSVDQASLIYTNCGNLIIPLVVMLLGEEYVFYTASYVVVFTVLIWTHGVSLIRGEKHLELRKVLLNPNILVIPLGLLLFLTGYRLPDIADTALQGLQNCIGPVSMFIVGIIFAGTQLKQVVDIRNVQIVFGRLILFPLIALALLYLSHAVRVWPFLQEVFLISMLSAAAPASNTVAQMAVLYDHDAASAGIYNFITTLLCVLTMPFIIWIYQALIR